VQSEQERPVHITNFHPLNKPDQQAALTAAIEAARQAYVFAANGFSFDAFLSVIALRDHLEGARLDRVLPRAGAGTGSG
jgi:hypothetical protein